MTRFNLGVGVIGLLTGVAAIVFTAVHPTGTIALALLVNGSFVLLGWFLFTSLQTLKSRIIDMNPSFRIDVLIMRFSFIFTVLLVNLMIRNDYARTKLLADPLQKVLSLKGKSYEWKRDEFKNENFPDGRHYGVIAQDIEKVLPDLVGTRPDGYKGVAYQEIVPILIEAVKEQQKIIDSQKKEVAEIKAMLQKKMNK